MLQHFHLTSTPSSVQNYKRDEARRGHKQKCAYVGSETMIEMSYKILVRQFAFFFFHRYYYIPYYRTSIGVMLRFCR